jgi:transcriptional regulator with XRE-family HTH domain
MILQPIQCRMARAALGMGVRELAAAAKVSADTVARFERGEELKERTIDACSTRLKLQV